MLMWWNKFNLLIYQKADDVYKVPIKSELTLDSQSLQELRLKSQYSLRGRRLKGKGKGVCERNARGARGGKEGGKRLPGNHCFFHPAP